MKHIEENQILKNALQAFEKATGLSLEMAEFGVERDGRHIDAIIKLPFNAGSLAAEVKKWAQHTNVGVIANQIQRLPIEGILAADYINPKMAEKLRENNIHFIDTAGNAYINKPPLYIWTTGSKPEKNAAEVKENANRAFDGTGLKVVFGFLCYTDLVNAPYREIAEKTEVALGTVGWVINGLKAAGYLIDKGKNGGRQIINYRKLLDRWVEAYPEKLKPKLKLGDFIIDNPEWWKKENIEQYNAYWGGEIAAAKYTGNLKPKILTIYQTRNADKKLFADAKLKKALHPLTDDSLVKIYQTFWPEKTIDPVAMDKKEFAGLVHPVLAYADLIATGDSRNMEVAKEIYEQYIAATIREG